MSTSNKKISQLPSTSKETSPLSQSNSDSITAIRQRRSQELVIGLCGAIGSGVKSLKDTLIKNLKSHGYHVEHIRLSSLICHASDYDASALSGSERYSKLQDLGDDLRGTHGKSIVADLAIREISVLRESLFGQKEISALKVTKKVAYILDQIKHPEEIELLNEVYRNNFYLIGLLRTEHERRKNLKDEGMPETDVSKLIERDRKSSSHYGQQVEASLHKSDYFIRNIDSLEEFDKSLKRFINLIHGVEMITPSKDETGMYSAYSASLRSACLSRQVGASISDDDGNILSTGCNDVPKFGGGLYSSADHADRRCFNYGQECHNDKHKNLLKQEISKILKDKNFLNADDVADEIIRNTKAKSLIEYSRAIHAEMDAIVSISRNPSQTSLGKNLYCTTYPCHVCARHIVAAGIKRVVYIEPYEKSLALQLHGDSICHPDNKSGDDKVIFENFEGVSPKRYAKFFALSRSRKDGTGKSISYTVVDSGHVDPQHLDSYVDYELKVVQTVNQKLPD